MAIYGSKDEYVVPINDRTPVVITDWDGDARLHGIALAPVGMKIEQARKTITDTFVEVRRENPEEWNFGDLVVKLISAGWIVHACPVWEEQTHGYPLGTPEDDS